MVSQHAPTIRDRRDPEMDANAVRLVLGWNAVPELVAELEEHVKALQVMEDALSPWAAERLAKGNAALAAARQT